MFTSFPFLCKTCNSARQIYTIACFIVHLWSQKHTALGLFDIILSCLQCCEDVCVFYLFFLMVAKTLFILFLLHMCRQHYTYHLTEESIVLSSNEVDLLRYCTLHRAFIAAYNSLNLTYLHYIIITVKYRFSLWFSGWLVGALSWCWKSRVA